MTGRNTKTAVVQNAGLSAIEKIESTKTSSVERMPQYIARIYLKVKAWVNTLTDFISDTSLKHMLYGVEKGVLLSSAAGKYRS